MFINVIKPKLQCDYTEKEILCDLIEKYIELANVNNSTLDDYMSIISLIEMLKKQYKEYDKDFEYYLCLFKDNGILDKYHTYFQNISKQIFEKNNWKYNIDLADNMLYGFFNGCTNRFMHFLIIFGLCGKPITKKQKYIMARLFEANTVSFSKQAIYYTSLYLKDGVIPPNNPFIKKDILIKLEKNRFYKLLGESYIREKEFNNSIKILNYTISIINSIPENVVKKEKMIDEINFKIKYANFKTKYPYVRKELIKKFNIDVKTFNLITKDIKNNEEYKLNSGYSEKIIEYIEEKLLN